MLTLLRGHADALKDMLHAVVSMAPAGIHYRTLY